MTRRFFLFDTKSGVEGTDNYKNGGISTVVRYPKDITLQIKLDPSNDEMIFTPLLKITYRERSKTGVEQNSLASVSFTSEYAMEMDNFWGTVTGIFIGIMVLAGVIVVVKIIVFATSPQLSSDPTALCKFGFYKFFVSSLEIFSNLAFWFLVITTGYWFVFFKLQERVYVLLPTVDSDSDYKPFEALFFVVVSTKFLSLLLKIRAE